MHFILLPLHWPEILLRLKETLAPANDCCSVFIYILDEINIKQINAIDELSFHSRVSVNSVYTVYMQFT